MRSSLFLLSGLGLACCAYAQTCPDFSVYSTELHAPFSTGIFNLSSMRPVPACRTFVSPIVDQTIASLKKSIADPDLFQLFQNSYPNTLDTAIKWKGVAADNPEEDLTFVITGDINAMWLRDSANQMQSYLPLLTASTSNDSIASLYRGVINLQARYILINPFCNSFQPPVESGVPPSVNGAADDDTVNPPYNNQSVFECKYELDSLAAFLEVSTRYFEATGDTAFFGKFNWVQAIQTVMTVATEMMTSTYAANGAVNVSPYTFTRLTTAGTETLSNSGIGNPTQSGTGLIRSAFRPSDDAAIYQFFIPANMMFARYLNSTAMIMSALGTNDALAASMAALSVSLRTAIQNHAITSVPGFGDIYAYEIDGFGSHNLMDDANIPSLLSLPFLGFLENTDPVYVATRNFILSSSNPYFMRGPVMNAVGGPHVGPGRAWPMANIVRILTSDNDTEIENSLREIVSSTDHLGLIHESVNTFDSTIWTRQWFSWANGLFGQMILDLSTRKPEVLKTSFQ